MKRILYITYDGLLDPLGSSQTLPYILSLSKDGYKFIIISFEKEDRGQPEINRLKYLLLSNNIIWVNLVFRKGLLMPILRLMNGAISIIKLSFKYNITGIHLRGFYPGLIYLMSCTSYKFIYDIRSFFAQMIDCKRFPKFYLFYIFFSFLERMLINRAAGIVVLDISAKEFLIRSTNYKKICEVIPTSTDLSQYIPLTKRKDIKSQIKFVFLGGARYPYLPNQALNFTKKFMEDGIDCTIDFINEREHAELEKLRYISRFPQENCNIFHLDPNEVPKKLMEYDCGLVFIDSGKWLSMCSPTKIGEYLAAGLHIVGLEGINVLDRLSKDHSCIDLVHPILDNKAISPLEFNSKKIAEKIYSNTRSENSRLVAKKFYDLEKANLKYLNLYKKLNI